jgi:hypothetical protein
MYYRAVPLTQYLQGSRGGGPFASPAGFPAVPETEFLGLLYKRFNRFLTIKAYY